MKRRIFILLATLSLLLCVITTIMWIRSYIWADTFRWSHWEPQSWPINCEIRSCAGCCTYSRIRHGFPLQTEFRCEPVGRRDIAPWFALEPDYDRYRLLGFEWWGRGSGLTVAIPYWFLTAATAILPAFSLIRSLRRRHRRKHNLCATCGYDLRASKDKCPECGTPSYATPTRNGNLVQ